MKLSVRQIVISGLLGAISIVLGVTRLGYITIPGALALSITIMHIPAILGAILEGPVVGLLIGLIFGISSFMLAPTEIPPGNLWFSDPLVSILPRIFIGVIAAYVYLALRKPNEWLASGSAAVAGTLTNTILVVGALILRGYVPAAVIIPLVIPNAIAEIIVSVVVVVAVVAAWRGVAIGNNKGSTV